MARGMCRICGIRPATRPVGDKPGKPKKVICNECYYQISKVYIKEGVCPLCGGEMAYLEPDRCMTEDCPNCVY
jgi:hypothetical protein